MPDENKPLPILKCPHCKAELTNIESRQYGDKGQITIIGCPNCLMAFGASLVVPTIAR